MTDTAIKVENLSKRYRIGLEEEVPDTMAGALLNFLKQPGRNLRRLRRLTRFGDNGGGAGDEPEDVIWALKDVSFEVKRGEVVGIIGRNGAGKSTLLKILSRITHPTSGRVELKGRVSSLLEVGTGFHKELTGRENIYLNGTILGMSKAEVDRKFDEIVAFSGVEKFIDTPVKRYSSGMKVRLAFAVAAHLEPEILLVDEVLAVGDAEFQKKCLGKMGEVAREGRTVLFVSHNMTSINRLCPRALWIEGGHISTDGKTEKIVSRYLSKDASAEGEILWPNGVADNGVEELRVHAIRIRKVNGDVTSTLDIREPFWVEINYYIRETVPYCRVGIIMETVQGVRVLETYDADSKQYVGSRSPSHYISRCKVPKRLLNPGRYVLSVNIGIPGFKKLALLENILVFDIEDPGASDSPLYRARRAILFPNFYWEQERDAS